MVPGYMGTGPEHWQTHWEHANPAIQRVEQDHWNRPERSAWVSRLDEYIGKDPNDTILVAHSLGCSTVAAWAAQNAGSRVAGALLVAPADLDRIDLVAELRLFGPMPLNPLPFKSIVVASDNDPYVTLDRARHFADRWGSTLIPIGACGHINSDAGFGPWPEGKAILATLIQEVST